MRTSKHAQSRNVLLLVSGYKIEIFLTVTSNYDKRYIFDELNL